MDSLSRVLLIGLNFKMVSDPIALALNIFPSDVEIQDEEYEQIVFNFHDLCRKDALERNSTILTCPNCGLQGNLGNMTRWHFDKCRTVLRKCGNCGDTIPLVKPYHRYKQMKYCHQACYMDSKIGHQPAWLCGKKNSQSPK